MPIPTQISDHQFHASIQISFPLTSFIVSQSKEFSIPSLQSIKCKIRETKQQLLNLVQTHCFSTLLTCLVQNAHPFG